MNMRRILGLLLGLLLLASLAPLSGAEFWEKKKFTQWNEKEVQKMLSDSPWTQDFQDADVHIDPLERPSLSSGPPANESGAGAPPTDDTDVGLRARESFARLAYVIQIRSALPLRQALVRRAQLQQNYERMLAEDRQRFDQEIERFLAEDFSDRVVIFVSFDSNIDFDKRELARHWQAQSTQTLKNSVFLIGGKGRKAELQDFKLANPNGQAFQLTFPRKVDGEELVGPGDKNLMLEFIHPATTRKPERRALVEFKVKKMLVDGQLEY